MKKVISAILMTIIVIASAIAQAPHKMSFQAVVRDASGNLVKNDTVGVQLYILQGSPTTGTMMYQETYDNTNPVTTNSNGLMTLQIGDGNIDWSNGTYFLKVEIDPDGGYNYTSDITTQFLSVPYAMYAEHCGDSVQGPVGPVGPAGPAGADGADGADGATGPQGPAGPGFNHYVGEVYGGGIVFYVYRDAAGTEHGLVLGPGEYTGNFSVTTSSLQISGNSIWDGDNNTSLLHNTNAGYLVDSVYNCTSGNYYDWYIPSVVEINQMYSQIVLINTSADSVPGFIKLFNISANLLFNFSYWYATSTLYYAGTNTYLTHLKWDGSIGTTTSPGSSRVRYIRKVTF